MKKTLLFIFTFIFGIISTVIFLCWHKWFPKGTTWDLEALAVWIGSMFTLAAIYFVVQNTNKQIKNQNKESHRPHLCMSRNSNVDESILEIIINFNVSVDSISDKKNNKRHYIKLFNAGYGTASNIRFIGTTYKSYKREISISYQDDSARNHLIEPIRENKYTSIGLGTIIDSQNKNIMLPIYILVFYTDFNQNIYSTLIYLETTNQIGFTINFYNDNRKAFSAKIKEAGIDYKKAKYQYIEETFTTT